MAFLTNFAIGVGNTLNKGFQEKEAKRAELIKYRMGVLEKEKEAYKATKTKAQEFTQQINSIASSTGIPANDVAAALKSGGVTAADIMKGNYRAVQDAVSSMKASEQPAQKPQQPAAQGGQPFPGRKPEVPGISESEMSSVRQGMDQAEQGPTGIQRAPSTGPAAQAVEEMRPQFDQSQMQGQAPGAPQAPVDPREAVPPAPQPQQAPAAQQGLSSGDQPTMGAQVQETGMWAMDKLRQGLFGRDMSGAGAEGERQFMEANGMSPAEFQAMQNYSEPTYEGSGTKYEFRQGEQFDPVKMIHAAKLEDIKPGMAQDFYAAAKAGEYGKAMGMLLTSQEKQDMNNAAAMARTQVSASASRAAGAAARPPTAVQNAQAYANMPEGPAKEALGQILFQSKGQSLEQQFANIDQSSIGKIGATDADIAAAKLRAIEMDRQMGGKGVPPGVEQHLREQAGLE